MRGTLPDLKNKLESFLNTGQVKSYCDLEFMDDGTNPALHGDVSAFVADFLHDGIEVLNYRIVRNRPVLDITGMVDAETRLEEVSPMLVLNKMMETESFSDEDKQMIMQAFIELTEMEDNEES